MKNGGLLLFRCLRGSKGFWCNSATGVAKNGEKPPFFCLTLWGCKVCWKGKYFRIFFGYAILHTKLTRLMKLHLPSELRAALLACFAAFSWIGTTLSAAAITGGVFAVSLIASTSVAQAAEYTVTNTSGELKATPAAGGDQVALNSLQAGDRVTFDATGWLPPGNGATYAADIIITSLTLNNGYSGAAGGYKVFNFNGSISGAGAFIRTNDQPFQRYNFNGDTSGYTGAIAINNNGSIVAFQNDSDTARVVNAASITNNNGTVIFKGGNTVKSSVTAGTVTHESGESTYAGAVTATNLNISAGAATFASTASVTGALNVASGTTLAVGENGALTLAGTVKLTGAIVNNGTLTLTEGLTLDLSDATFAEESGTYTLALITGNGTVNGLDNALSNIDLVLSDGLAGKEISYADGVLSYVVTAASLNVNGGVLSWDVGAKMLNSAGEETPFVAGDIVTFTGDTEATLAEAVSATAVTLEEGATLSLSNGGVDTNTLSTQRFIVNGELILKDAVLASDALVLAESTGSVVISGGTGQSPLDFTSQLSEYVGAVTVEGGRMKLSASKSTPFSSITVKDGGQLELLSAVGTYSGNVTITGHGVPGDAEFYDSALRTQNVTLSGKLTAEGDTSVAMWGEGSSMETLTITGELAGYGTITKKEGGQLKLHGTVSHSGTLNIAGGGVLIGNAAGASNTVAFSGITVGNGSTLVFNHGMVDLSHMSITMAEGADLQIFDSNSGNGVEVTDPYHKSITVGSLKVGGNADLYYTWKGVFKVSELTGSGDIAVKQTQVVSDDPRATIFANINNYSGTISGEIAQHKVYVDAVHQEAGYEAIISGVGDTVYTTNFRKTGAGTLIIADGVTVDGVLTMNYEGKLFHQVTEEEVTSNVAGLNIVSVADGTVLTYTSAEKLLNLTATAVGDASLLIDVLDVADKIAATGINLGIASTVSRDQLNVSAIEGANLVNKDGYWWLSGGTVNASWDINWGAVGLDGAPATMPSNASVSGTIVMGDNATYHPEGSGRSELLITGTTENGASIYGGFDNTGEATSRTAEFDSWIKMTGGDVFLIVGGNNCSAWQNASAHHFNGNSHILIESAGEGDAATTPVVDYIVGGNYKDGYGTNFTGNSYISVKSDSVQGTIAGGHAQAHSSNANFTGDSHIYIYTPQTRTADTVWAATNNGGIGSPNAIVGGNIKIAHTAGTNTFTGDTHVVLDFASYTGDAVTMAKEIVGGSFNSNNNSSTHTGNTNVTIRNAATTTFSKDIIGGSKAGGNTGKISGISTLDISSGTFSGMVIGGSHGSSSSGGSTYSIGGVNMTLGGGTYNGNVMGGHYQSDSGTNALTVGVAGDISITVKEGTTIAADLYGGSYIQRNNGAVTCAQKNITLDLQGGTISGNVYAAGYQGNASKLATISTTVNLSSAVVLGTSTVSGGYGGSGSGSTVSGGRTLAFTSAETYNNISNATFADFDVMSVVANGSVAIKLAEGSAMTKVGAGSLALSAAVANGSVTVQEGTLALNGHSLTATTVLGGATLDASVAGSNGGALTLGSAANEVVNLNLVGGMALDSLALTSGVKMNVLGATSFDTDGILTLFTGLTADKITGMVFAPAEEGAQTASLAEYISNAADFNGAGLMLTANGDLIITTQGAGGAWKWNAVTTDGVWSATSVEDWSNASGTTPDGNSLTFGNEGLAASGVTAVVISGPVAPTRVTVNASSGEYIFTADDDDTTVDGIGGAASLVKNGAGKLTISLANTYSGGTTINDGTLEATVTGALGSGNVALNGGTLNLSAALDNKIVFGGGTLNYLEDVTVSLDKIGRTDAGSVLVSVAEGKTATWTAGSVAAFGNGMTLSGTGTLKITDGNRSAYGTTESSFTIAEGATLHIVSSSPNADIMSKLLGSGKVLLEGNGGAVSMQGDNSGFAGTLELNSANDSSGTPFYFHTATAGGGAQTTLLLNNAIFRSSGNAISAGTVQLVGDNYLNDMKYGNGAATTTLSGALTGNGNLKVSKGSTLNLAGNLTGFTGDLSEGADGTGSIYVDFGGRNGEGTVSYAAAGNIFGLGVDLTTSAEGASAEYRFNYSNDTLNMNATAGGAAALVQNGTGKIVLTQDNSSTGTLTVNNGTVAIGADGGAASWAGAYDVNGTGVLEFSNVTGQSVAGAIVADATATVKVTGATAEGATVTLASLQGGTLESTGNVTINENSSVNGLDNSGTITMAVGKGFTVNGTTTNGGNVVADQIVLGGDATFGRLDVANGLMSNDGGVGRNLTLNGDSTITGIFGPIATLTSNAVTTLKTDNMYLRGDLVGTGSVKVEQGQLTLESGTANLDGSASASGNVNLNGTGAHRFGGDLTVGGTLNVAGTLSVGGALTTSAITFNLREESGSLPKPGPIVTVGSLSGDALGLTFAEKTQLTALNLGQGGIYTLLSSTADLSSSLALTASVGSPANDATNKLVLDNYSYTFSVDGNKNIIITCAVTTDVIWDAQTDSDGVWSADASWQGGVTPTGGASVGFLGAGSDTVAVGTGAVAGKVMVDVGTGSTQAYTFDAAGDGAALQTGDFDITAGDVTLAVDTTVADTVTTGATGQTVVGTAADNATSTASLTVQEGTAFATGSLRVNETGTFTNAGETTVTGALTAATVSNSGSLTVGAGTAITEVTGTGTLTVAGDGVTDAVATIGSVDSGATLAASSAKTTLNVAALGDTAGSFNGSLAEVATVAGSTVALQGATGTNALTVEKLSGAGTFLAAGVAVTLTQAATDGTSVMAESLDLTAASGSTFGVVTAGAYTLDLTAVAADSKAVLMSTSLMGTTDIQLTLTGVDALVEAAAGALAVDGVDSVDYTLISQSDALAAALNVDLTNAAAIHQLFAQAGKYNAGLLPDANAATLYATAVAVGNNVVLRVSTEAERVWNTKDDFAGELDFNGIDNWYTRLAYVDEVNVNQTTTIDLTNLNGADSIYDPTAMPEGLNVQNLMGNSALTIKGSDADLATITNKENTVLNNTLTIEGTGFQTNVVAEGGATLGVNELALVGGAMVNVDDSATFSAGKLTAADAAAGTISGKVNITGTGGRYMGSYAGATINMAAAGASQVLAPAAGLTVTGSQGTAILDYKAGNATMGTINTTGASVTLDNIAANGKMNTLTLAQASSMQQGELAFGVNAADVAKATSGGTAAPVITQGAALNLSGTTLKVTQADADVVRATIDVSQGTEDITLFTVSADGSMDGVSVVFNGNNQFFSRYFKNIEVKGGKVVADIVTDYYSAEMGSTDNGKVGLELMDAAFLGLNPLGEIEGADKAQYKDLAGVLHALEDFMAGDGSRDAEADKLGAAVAGSGVASLGMALSGDMERQLKAIRNRTTTMGVDPSVINEDMPYFNAWINAEGDHRSMDEDGTLAGYTLTSWGGTVGFDMDVNDRFTWGLALTAMYADFSAESAGMVEGDVNTYYVSSFARANVGAWVHTFVATAGLSQNDISRTVTHTHGSYTTEGDPDGLSFGLLYEVARTYALNEDATACWQPVFNVAYRHIEVDGYSESGSDAALRFGDQSLDTVTFGLGARLQAVVGESIYNRTSILELRALVKVDAGDRESELDSALLNLPSAGGKIKSAEMDALGIELGGGLTVPVGFDAGSIFLDGSLEFRGSYTSANATFGYRVNF